MTKLKTRDHETYLYDMAVGSMSNHVCDMAQILENAAKDMRRHVENMRAAANAEKNGERTFASPMDYYSWSIQSWTNVQQNLRLDLVPNNTSAFVLARQAVLK